MAEGNLSSSTQKQLEQILTKKTNYVIKLDKKERRSLGLNPTMDELYEFVATMAKDLQKKKIL